MSVQELLLLTLLKKIEEKYGPSVHLRMYSDGSGSIYKQDTEILEFESVDELLKQLA